MRRLLAVLAVSGTTLAGLLTVNTVAADSATPAKAAPTITITSFTYTGSLTVRPGQTVRVKNADPFAHSATNPKGKFDTGTIPGGRTRSFVAPKRVGDFAIRCNFHGSMAGTLHVVRPSLVP